MNTNLAPSRHPSFLPGCLQTEAPSPDGREDHEILTGRTIADSRGIPGEILYSDRINAGIIPYLRKLLTYNRE